MNMPFCLNSGLVNDNLSFSLLRRATYCSHSGVWFDFLPDRAGWGCCSQYVRAIGLLVYMVCILPLSVKGVQDSLIPNRRMDGATRFAAVDHLGHVYRITGANGIEKYASSGQFLVQYTGQREGNADYLDVVNPMKILVWYRDFRTVVMLDRNLTVLGSLNLLQAGFPEVRTVASSRDGHFWMYDDVLFRLMKITQEGVVLHEGPHLGQWYGRPISISWMEESDTRLYAMDQSFGLLVFDAFGQPLAAYPMARRPKTIDVQRDAIWYVEGTELVVWWPALDKQEVVRLPDPGLDGAWLISEGHLLRVGSSGLLIYPLPGVD